MLPRAFYCPMLNVKITAITVLMTGIKWAADEDDEDGGGGGDDDLPLTFCRHLGHLTECKSRQFHLDERISLQRELVIVYKALNTYFRFLRSSHTTERIANIFANAKSK